MIAGRDSSADRPSIEQLWQAMSEGVQNWGGYIATRGGVNLYSPWDYASFERVKQVLPSMPLAYCSGWDDPVACAQRAQEWGVRLCLDVEDGIRGDGDWVQGWLDASGAGLYANRATCMRWRAPFKVMAHYLYNDPGATWEGEAPDVPHAWQWGGDVYDWGLGVDRLWMDDWFLSGAAVTVPLVREENAVSLETVRQDGTQDFFTVLPRGGMYHASRDPGGGWGGGFLHGNWGAVLEAVWTDPSHLWVTGLGFDGGIWQMQWTGEGGWTEPYQLA